MRRLSLALLAAAILVLPHAVLAQAPASEPPPAPRSEPAPGAATGQDAEPEKPARPRRGRRGRAATGKRAECRNQAKAQGLRRSAARDAATICWQEARLDCLKKAIADGVMPRERRAFIANCMGEEPRERGAGRGKR